MRWRRVVLVVIVVELLAFLYGLSLSRELEAPLVILGAAPPATAPPWVGPAPEPQHPVRTWRA